MILIIIRLQLVYNSGSEGGVALDLGLKGVSKPDRTTNLICGERGPGCTGPRHQGSVRLRGFTES